MSARNFLLILFIGLLLVGCEKLSGIGGSAPDFANNIFGNNKNDAGLQFEKVDIKGVNPKKGLVIGFQEGNPGGKNGEIFGDFNVGLDIASYMQDPVSAEMDLWDNAPYPGFDDKENVQLQVGSAEYVDGKLYPGIGQYPWGFFQYSFEDGGPELTATTQFFASVRYDVHSDVAIHFCVTNPKGEYDQSCKNNQALSTSGKNPEIDSKSQQYPVYVKKVVRYYAGTAEDTSDLTLDIDITNEGDGDVVSINENEKNPNEFNVVNFDIVSIGGVIDLRCRSDASASKLNYNDPDYSGLPMKLQLNDGRSAKVTCNAKVPIAEPIKAVSMNLQLDYTYLFSTKTDEIKVKG